MAVAVSGYETIITAVMAASRIDAGSTIEDER
jgi:hypothetical protein